MLLDDLGRQERVNAGMKEQISNLLTNLRSRHSLGMVDCTTAHHLEKACHELEYALQILEVKVPEEGGADRRQSLDGTLFTALLHLNEAGIFGAVANKSDQ